MEAGLQLPERGSSTTSPRPIWDSLLQRHHGVEAIAGWNKYFQYVLLEIKTSHTPTSQKPLSDSVHLTLQEGNEFANNKTLKQLIPSICKGLKNKIVKAHGLTGKQTKKHMQTIHEKEV